MDMSTLVISVTEGVAIAAVLWIFHIMHLHYRICDQRSRIRKIISDGVRDIKRADEPTDLKRHVGADATRKIFYDLMYEEIMSVLNHRGNELSYDDEKAIRNAFVLKKMMEASPGGCPSGIEPYETTLFENLEKVKWLKKSLEA